jgi:hypothetical protein
MIFSSSIGSLAIDHWCMDKAQWVVKLYCNWIIRGEFVNCCF